MMILGYTCSNNAQRTISVVKKKKKKKKKVFPAILSLTFLGFSMRIVRGLRRYV